MIHSFLNIYRIDWHASHKGVAVVFIAHHSLWLVLIAPAYFDGDDDDVPKRVMARVRVIGTVITFILGLCMHMS